MAVAIVSEWPSSEPLPPLLVVAAALLGGYLLFELGFFYHYHWTLVPRANRISRGPPAPYRDYPDVQDRQKLLVRILERLIEHAPKHGDEGADEEAVRAYVYKFIESWFEKKRNVPYDKFSAEFDLATLDVGFCPPPPEIIRMAWSSLGGNASSGADELSDGSSDSLAIDGEPAMQSEECNGANDAGTAVQNAEPVHDRIQKGNMDEFFSWAFFGVDFSTVQSTPEMQQALDNLYPTLEARTGLRFEPGTNPNYRPRSFTFENAVPLYRPYGVYAGVALMRMVANCTLYLLGFRQHTCSRGLRYWHRPAKQRLVSPFLFFHGIAPGGHAPYLPMLFVGMLRGELSYRYRDVFLFENKPISYALCFDAISEEDTVHGVLEAIHRHLGTSSSASNLTLCGHSMGSCSLTWMMGCPEIKRRVRSLVLLDPVSIMLSEPDVVVNFLYTRQDLQDPTSGNLTGWAGRLIRFVNETKIHLVASSEMFIESYLRRNFAWYNSELWLQDIPYDVKVIVCLAENDEIVNTPKIEREIALHNSKVSKDAGKGAVVDRLIWPEVGHAHCVMNPERWSDVHHAMRKIESQVQRDDACRKAQ